MASIPDQDSIVHHVIAFYVTPDSVAAAEAADAAEEGPGYTCFGGPGFGDIRDTKWLGSWAPGGLASDFPAGTGIPVEAGSKIVLQVHYNTLSTDPVPDQTSVNFKLDATVEKEAEFFLWANPAWLDGSMPIAAGEADAQHTFAFDPTPFLSGGKPIKFYGGFIHMHKLGKAARLTIQRGGDAADEDCLMDIPNYDFNWQSGVRFMEPKLLNPGDRLSINCHWDNTLDNQVQVDGVPLPVQDVNWGDGTTDEMCLGVMYATIED